MEPGGCMDSDSKCFGKLDEVFPPGAGGLREVPALCGHCEAKTECLRAAIASEEGIAFRERRALDAGSGRFSGLLRRWSELKTFAREREKAAKKRK